MPIKIKVDENGHAVLQDGMPVCIHEDGKEFVHNIDDSVRKILNFNEERDRHTKKLTAANEKLKAFDGIDPEKAREALNTVADLDGKKLLDAKGVQALRNELKLSFDEKLKGIKESTDEKVKDYENQLEGKDKQIYDLTVREKFHSHPLFAGNDPKTFLQPSDAVKIFGDRFTVEQTEDGKTAIRARNADGSTIFSRENHGEPAEFNEAMDLIFDSLPNKENYLRGSKGSHHQTRHSTNPNDKNAPKTSRDLIKAGLREQKKNRGGR